MKTSANPAHVARTVRPRTPILRPNAYGPNARIACAARTWLSARIASLVAKSKARHTARELSVLSDEELWDIGLLRADIAEVAATTSRPAGSIDQRAKRPSER